MSEMSGPTRCALLLYSLGLEQASAVLERLDPQEVFRINEAARRLGELDQTTLNNILAEFQERMSGRKLLAGESASFMQAALQRVGTALPEGQAFLPELGMCPEADPEMLTNTLKHEHPQTVAIVLAHIDADRAAKVLKKLTPELQIEAITRMAQLTTISQPVLKQIETVLENELKRQSQGPQKKIVGGKVAAEILKKAPKTIVTNVLDGLMRQNEELFQSVKKNLFVFNDLLGMDDRGVRNLLKEIDGTVLAKALKVAEPGIRNKFFKNMSSRASTMLQEDVETLPPMRLSEVEEAQRTIMDAASALVQDGRATFAGASDEDQVV